MSSVWCIVFFLVVTDNPITHRFISEKERDYIMRETSKTSKVSNQVTFFQNKR